MTDDREPERCEVCDAPVWGYWGWDGTPLCRDHYAEADRRRARAEEEAER